MATTFGCPFTLSQWKELKTQAMIYKYMMESVPVPPHLLSPTHNLSPDSHSFLNRDGSTSPLNLIKHLKRKRCTRTDGEKWRCSRDVAPHQQYCEHHMSLCGRHSEKPVEVHAPFTTNNNVTTTTTTNNNNNKKARIDHHPFLATTPVPFSKQHPSFDTNISSPQLLGPTIQPNETPVLALDSNTEERVSDSSYKKHSSRDTSEQQWQHFMSINTPLTRVALIDNIFQQLYRNEPLNLASYKSHHQNIDSPLFLNPEPVASEEAAQMEALKRIIDDWSYDDASIYNNGNKNMLSVSSNSDILLSSLTVSMAMAAGNALDERMVLGLEDSDDNHGIGCSDISHVLSWLSPVSYASLAEVLRHNGHTGENNAIIF
ncbi:growth-regulating factor 4-like [Cornus florida]|uniref:growth-regulating factor 4-like n=1 Tax=Cornus florida TaxID=4283 RepID=UPI00289BF727|nr:growth-regulating factor 4-like [Cornus florida]